jgi:hypothetical protein
MFPAEFRSRSIGFALKAEELSAEHTVAVLKLTKDSQMTVSSLAGGGCLGGGRDISTTHVDTVG